MINYFMIGSLLNYCAHECAELVYILLRIKSLCYIDKLYAKKQHYSVISKDLYCCKINIFKSTFY